MQPHERVAQPGVSVRDGHGTGGGPARGHLLVAQAELQIALPLAGGALGDYRRDLGDSSYRITRNPGAQEFCTGSVTPVGDRLLLSADRGSWCLDFHYAEVGWELGEDELWLPREQFRGPTVDLLLWTGKPLRRVG